jgi:hypothetical protein
MSQPDAIALRRRASALPSGRWTPQTDQKLGRAAFELDSLGRPAGPNGLGSVGSLGLKRGDVSSPTRQIMLSNAQTGTPQLPVGDSHVQLSLQRVTRNWQAPESSPAERHARAAHSSQRPAQVRVGQENVVT